MAVEIQDRPGWGVADRAELETNHVEIGIYSRSRLLREEAANLCRSTTD